MNRGSAPLPLPDPPLAGHRFALRPWRIADARALVTAWADPQVARWTRVPSRPDESTACRWILGDDDRRSRGRSLDLVIDVEGEVAGEVGLTAFDGAARTAEMGWWVASSRRGQGLASGAAALVAAWAITELCVDAVLARCDSANPGSGRVARTAGFDRLPRTGTGGDELWSFTASSGATLGV